MQINKYNFADSQDSKKIRCLLSSAAFSLAWYLWYVLDGVLFQLHYLAAFLARKCKVSLSST